MDQITQSRIALLHPKLRDEVTLIFTKLEAALKGRAKVRLAQGLRTFEEQNALYAQGRTKLFDAQGKKLGVVTKAKGGESYHNYGLAIDFVLYLDGKTASWDTLHDFDGDGKSDWLEVVEIFKQNGLGWGGDWKSFKDLPHVEKTFDLSVKTLLSMYNSGKFIPGTKYIQI